MAARRWQNAYQVFIHDAYKAWQLAAYKCQNTHHQIYINTQTHTKNGSWQHKNAEQGRQDDHAPQHAEHIGRPPHAVASPTCFLRRTHTESEACPMWDPVQFCLFSAYTTHRQRRAACRLCLISWSQFSPACFLCSTQTESEASLMYDSHRRAFNFLQIPWE